MLFSGKHRQPPKWPHRTIFGYHSRRTTGKSSPPFLPSFLFPLLNPSPHTHTFTIDGRIFWVLCCSSWPKWRWVRSIYSYFRFLDSKYRAHPPLISSTHHYCMQTKYNVSFVVIQVKNWWPAVWVSFWFVDYLWKVSKPSNFWWQTKAWSEFKVARIGMCWIDTRYKCTTYLPWNTLLRNSEIPSILWGQHQSISCFSFDELVVGAPMYTDIRRAATEIGRVYVFNNTGVSTF